METLAGISGVELWEVKDSLEELLAKGELSITCENSIVTCRVGSISWRLVPTLRSLKVRERSYVFAIDEQESRFFCLNIPQDATDDDVVVLEATLESFTAYEQSSDVGTSKTDQLIKGIGYATSKAVDGLSVAAHYVGDALIKGAEMYKNRSKACEEPKPVSETTKKRVQRVKDVAKMAAGVAHGAVEAVSVFTSQAADAIIGSTKPSDAQKNSTKAKKVAAAVVVSAAEIYEGMVDAFLIVSKKTAHATTEVVTHKFGAEAGEVTQDGMAAVGHSANALVQSSRLGAKAVLKTTAKKTAVAYMQNENSTAIVQHTQQKTR